MKRFSLAANAKGVCAEIMLGQKSKARWRFELIVLRFSLLARRRLFAGQAREFLDHALIDRPLERYDQLGDCLLYTSDAADE